jgi:hypothetical protein
LGNLLNLLPTNFVLPFWAKYVAIAVLATVIYGWGYTNGLQKVYKEQANVVPQIVFKQGKVTTKVVTKYIKIREKQEKIDKEIRNEGNSYAIRFPTDSYTFNNEFVRLHDNSVTGRISTLSSGESAADSGVSVSEALSVVVDNNIVGRQWKQRALQCEEWAKVQEEESVK